VSGRGSRSGGQRVELFSTVWGDSRRNSFFMQAPWAWEGRGSLGARCHVDSSRVEEGVDQ